MTEPDDRVTVELSAEAAQHALDAVTRHRAALLDQARSSKRERVKVDAFRAAARLYEASLALGFPLGRRVGE